MTDTSMPPEDLQEALRQQIEALIGGPTFHPVDLSGHPDGAPEGVSYLDMFEGGLDHMVKFHVHALNVEPVDALTSTQSTLNRLSASGFTTEELAGLLSVAIDRIARDGVAQKDVPSWLQRDVDSHGAVED